MIDKTKVFWRKVENKIFICHSVTGDTYQLEDSAAFIWELIVAGKNTEEIVDALGEEYEVDQEIARGDIQDILHQFKKEGLMTADVKGEV